MNVLVGTGWVLLALEVLFVGALFVTKNMGDDAAGRGMARGFALLLGPVVLLAGALLAWGSRGGPKAVLWIAPLMVFAPDLYGAASLVSGPAGKLDQNMGQAEFGRFDDAALTALARAITKGDTAAVTQMLAKTRPDWNARDRRDQTILGHAIVRALDDYSGVDGGGSCVCCSTPAHRLRAT